MIGPMIEGIVENGQIRLLGNVTLPERAKVFVVLESGPVPRVYSPRLAHPEQAGDFVKPVIEGPFDAPV